MKKLFLISVILVSAILAWCAHQKWLSEDELFEKKQECISYRNDINQDILRRFSVEVWEFEDSELEIFYSPSKNSCLYLVHFIRDIGEWHAPKTMISYVYDYLSSIEVLKIYYQSATIEEEAKFEIALQELRGE